MTQEVEAALKLAEDNSGMLCPLSSDVCGEHFEQIRDLLRKAVSNNDKPAKMHTSVIEIKEGPDLDRAVAEAIGFVCTHRTLDGKQFFSDPRDPLPGLRTFLPSTDLNYAFHAAEAVVKYSYGSVELPPCITVDNRTGWRCTIEDSPEGRGRTPALAICAAILKVSKNAD